MSISDPYLHYRPARIQRHDLANDRVMRCRHDRVGMAFGVEEADEILGSTASLAGGTLRRRATS